MGMSGFWSGATDAGREGKWGWQDSMTHVGIEGPDGQRRIPSQIAWYSIIPMGLIPFNVLEMSMEHSHCVQKCQIRQSIINNTL